MHEKGGKILALLDGVTAEELFKYGDLKDKSHFGDSAEAFQKVITYSEIRHMLRNWDKLQEKGTVQFFRQGKPVNEEEIEKLRKAYEEKRLKSRERKKVASEAFGELKEIKKLSDFQEKLKLSQRSAGGMRHPRWGPSELAGAVAEQAQSGEGERQAGGIDHEGPQQKLQGGQ